MNTNKLLLLLLWRPFNFELESFGPAASRCSGSRRASAPAHIWAPSGISVWARPAAGSKLEVCLCARGRGVNTHVPTACPARGRWLELGAAWCKFGLLPQGVAALGLSYPPAQGSGPAPHRCSSHGYNCRSGQGFEDGGRDMSITPSLSAGSRSPR